MLLELLTILGYIFVTLLLGLITVGVVYARWNYGVLESTKGLKFVVPPYFIGGSDPFFYKDVVSDVDTKRVKKYGSIFGIYEGRNPQIFISDPEIIKHVFIKDFDHFQNKRELEAGHELINDMMDMLQYDKWKVVRNYFSPQLTTGKIRGMSYQMVESIKDFITGLKRKSDGKQLRVQPKETFTAVTVDVIARCAFGTKINALDDPNNPFLKHIKVLSFEDMEPGLVFSAVFTFPFLAKMGTFFPPETVDYYGNILRDILSSRRASGQKMNDFVDCMNEMIDKSKSDPEYKKLGITEVTAMCQAMIFLLAGFETTATTMTLLAFRLAKDPEIQDKVIKEVDEFFYRHGEKIDHEHLNELTYLNACIMETLRMNPALIRVERVCGKDWTYEPEGLVVKKGTTIQVPVYAVHFDDKNYKDPHFFKPERFLPENKEKLNPYAFLAFGQGPHNCIGMRFAKEEIQMCMASLLRQFRFQDLDGAKLKMKLGRTFGNNYEPFHLTLVPRD